MRVPHRRQNRGLRWLGMGCRHYGPPCGRCKVAKRRGGGELDRGRGFGHSTAPKRRGSPRASVRDSREPGMAKRVSARRSPRRMRGRLAARGDPRRFGAAHPAPGVVLIAGRLERNGTARPPSHGRALRPPPHQGSVALHLPDRCFAPCWHPAGGPGRIDAPLPRRRRPVGTGLWGCSSFRASRSPPSFGASRAAPRAARASAAPGRRDWCRDRGDRARPVS